MKSVALHATETLKVLCLSSAISTFKQAVNLASVLAVSPEAMALNLYSVLKLAVTMRPN